MLAMEESRIHRLLEHRRGGEPFSFKMDLKGKRCTEDEIQELVAYGYIERVLTSDPNDILYRITRKGETFLK